MQLDIINISDFLLSELRRLIHNMVQKNQALRPSAIELVNNANVFSQDTRTLTAVIPLSQLANQKILEVLNSNPMDNLDVLKSLNESLLTYITPRLNFAAYYLLKGLEAANTYFMDTESKYREMFITNRNNQILKDPYLFLENVFQYDTPYVFRPPKLSANNIVFFAPSTEEGASQLCPKSQFLRQWNHITHGIFTNVDTTNLFFAGGAVLAALQPFDEDQDLDTQLEQSGYYNSDIDVFMYGITSPEQATLRAEQFCEEIVMLCNGDVLLLRTVHTLTIIRPYPKRQIQLIFRLYCSPAEVLMGFDIDSCCVGYDGTNVYGLPRFSRSIITGYNLVDISRRSPSYEYRLYKYSKRGFGVLVEGVNRNDIDFDYSHINATKGIHRLIAFERGMAVQLNERKNGKTGRCFKYENGTMVEVSIEDSEMAGTCL
ncbi:hypothetical protein BC833DRAFT_208230 [Globomyces pollinis-pini]|nr:hypothetical protein BC833DRAFT_208230 [Globomyces pollinis-pini]